MVDAFKRLGGFVVLIHSVLFLLPARSFARNQVMEAVHIVPATKVEKGSGVWIDGQYVGYVTELKGHNKAMVLPGPHNIVVRRSGYIDLIEKVTVQPGSAVEI